ncbi:MAG: alanine racemase [Hamadaea sp.]|nr:alanine racemase [Hamadaea sp.]
MIEHTAELTVDLAAVRGNVRTVRAGTRAAVMAVVKANAFGHGAVPVARAALDAGATWLGVTSAAEALALRQAGVGAPILSWLHRVDTDFAPLIRREVDLGVSAVPQLRRIADAARAAGRAVGVHLKADTGLTRNGAAADDWPELVRWAAKLAAEGSVRVTGVWSHLAAADAPGDRMTDLQLAAFRDAVDTVLAAGLRPQVLHLANSAATLTRPDTHFDLCRVGLALYGVEPVPGRQHGLRPAMTLRTAVINVKRVPAGTGVSYRHEYVTRRPSTLALLPVGYADGLPRTAEGRAQVWLGGRCCPIVGRIAMDQCVVDVGAQAVAIGDPAVVFGPGCGGEPTAADWATWAGTSPHEILTGAGSRSERSWEDA